MLLDMRDIFGKKCSLVLEFNFSLGLRTQKFRLYMTK